jgi:hypothetical protein
MINILPFLIDIFEYILKPMESIKKIIKPSNIVEFIKRYSLKPALWLANI